MDMDGFGLIWVWISGYLDVWISGYLDIWISGYLDIWISEYLDIWISGYLDIWISSYYLDRWIIEIRIFGYWMYIFDDWVSLGVRGCCPLSPRPPLTRIFMSGSAPQTHHRFNGHTPPTWIPWLIHARMQYQN